MKRIVIYRTFFIILMSSLFYTCNEKSVDFPDIMENEITDLHHRINGTKIFAKIPEGFIYSKSLLRYQNDKNFYIQFTESNELNFYKTKAGIISQILGSEEKNIRTLKTVKFNNFDGMFGESFSDNKEDHKILFMFGNNEFTAVASVVFLNRNPSNRNQVLNILNSLVYNKNAKIEPLELSNFEFDKSITNFKYSYGTSNTFTYNELGVENINDPIANNMTFLTLPKISQEQGETFLNSIITKGENNGYVFKSPILTKKRINDYQVVELKSEQEFDQNKGILYAVILIGENSGVAFLGNSFSNQNQSNLFEKYIETVKSIKIIKD